MGFLFFLFIVSLFIFIFSLLLRRFIIGSIRKYLMEAYGTSNFSFKYGIHTVSIDYLCGHGPDSDVKIVSLEIQFDVFGYLFKKLPFLRCQVGQISFELNTNKSGDNKRNKNQFFNYACSNDNLNSRLKSRQRNKYQKQNPQKLRIHQLNHNQDNQVDQNEENTISQNDVKQNDASSQQQQNNFAQDEIQNQNQQETPKSDQKPLERWIARRLLSFVLAIFVRSAQIDNNSFTLKIGHMILHIKNISIFYNRSATSIVSHIHYNEMSLTTDKQLPFLLSPQENVDANGNNDENNDNNAKGINNSNNNSNENTEDSESVVLFRVPDISVTITSDTQSFKYFLGGMLSQYLVKIEELNIDYSDGQMSVSSIQSQMYVRNDPSSKTQVDVSQVLVMFPVSDFYTKTFSGTVNDIIISLDSGKIVSGPILITRNEQPFFSSHSMKYRKGKADFEYLDATISTPFIIDLSLFKKYFGVFSEEIGREFQNLSDSRNNFSKFDSEESEDNIRPGANEYSSLSNFYNSTDSSNTIYNINDTDSNLNINNNNNNSSSLSEATSAFNEQSEIQNEIEMDIEKYDQKPNGDNDSEDESRNEFESVYDFTDDYSWAQGSESSSNYKFSVEDEMYYKSKSNFGSNGAPNNSSRRYRRIRRKKNQSSLIINATTAILRFNLSDNHVMTYNMKQFSYSNNLITAKSFTLDTSFTDFQHVTSALNETKINEELKNSSSKLAFIEQQAKSSLNGNINVNANDYPNYQKLVHRFFECHHASFNFNNPLIAFKCSTGNVFLTNEFAEASFMQEFLALFRFIHNQTKVNNKFEKNISKNDSNLSLKNDEKEKENESDENEEDNQPLTQYCLSCDIHKFMIEMKANSLVSKIHRSNEAKRLAIEGLQIRQEKAIQIMNANLLNEANSTSSSSFSLNEFEQSSRKMLFDLYKASIEKVQVQKDDDLFYVLSKDFHISIDGPKIKNRKEGIEELKKAVKFTKKKGDIYRSLKKKSKIKSFDDEYNKYSEKADNDQIQLNDDIIENENSDVFNKKNEKFDKHEFEDNVNKIGAFDGGVISLNAASITVSAPRIGTISTFKAVKTNGTMLIMKQKALKNDDLYHFPIHCDQKSIELMIPRISHRTITVFNIDECLCDDAYFKYSAAFRELQQDFFFGTLVFGRHKFSFQRLEFFDNMRLRYRLKLNMNIKSLDIDYNTKYDVYSQFPLFRVQLPNFKVVCDDNETFQLSSENIYLKILNNEQLDYSFLLTLPGPSMKLKFISYNPIYEALMKNLTKKLNDDTGQSKLKFTKDELLLLRCRCKKRPFFIPIHGYRMNDPSYDPYKMFRTQSFSAHFILNFDNSQNASLNLDFLQPVIDSFIAKKSVRLSFIEPCSYINHYYCPKLNFVDFSIKFPGVLVTMNKNKIISKIIGDNTSLKFNNRQRKSMFNSNEQNKIDEPIKNYFSLDVNGQNMKINATIDEHLLADFQISTINVNYEKGYSVDVNIGNITSEFSPLIINLLAYPPIIKMNQSNKTTKLADSNSTALPLTMAIQQTSNSSIGKNSTSSQQTQSNSQNDSNDDNSLSSSYFTFAFPKYENHTELPTFDRDDQFQKLFKKRTVMIKIDSAITTLRFSNNKTMKSIATSIRFEQRIIPKNDEEVKNQRQSNMIDFDFNLCPPLQSIAADSFTLTTAKKGVQLINLEKPYFAFSKATNLTYYQIVGSTLTISPTEEDFSFFIPAAKNFFNDIYSIHKERQRNELEKSESEHIIRAVTSSSYLRQFVIRLIGSDMTTLGTMTGDDIIVQIRRSDQLLEIGQILIRKITAINELVSEDSFKKVIETTKEPFLTVKYDKPPIHMKNSFIQSIRIMINPFKLRIDTSYFKKLNNEFPSASLLRVFILEGEIKSPDGEISEVSEISTENDLSKPKSRTKHGNSMTHSSSDHFSSISGLEQSDMESSNAAAYDDNLYKEKKKKKNKDKSKAASESDTEANNKKYEKSEKKRQKKEKKERKKENKKLAKESFYNRALRLKNIFFCQHFTFLEVPIEVSFRSYDDNNSPYSNSQGQLNSATSSSSAKDNQNTLTPTNLIVDRNMQIGNLEIVDFYGDYKMLFKDISWHLKSSYFRSLSSLLLKKKRNSQMSPPKPDS